MMAAARVKAGAKKAASGAKKVAKVASMVVVPAVPTSADIVRNRKKIATEAASHMRAIRAGESGAKLAAASKAARALGPLSTYILPVLAGVTAVTTVRDAIKHGRGTGEALEDGAYAGVDLILGHALTEFNKSRERGEGRAAAVTTATLKGIDNRFLFGLFQRGMEASRKRDRDADSAMLGEFGQEQQVLATYTGGETALPPEAPSQNNGPDATTLNIVRHESGVGPQAGNQTALTDMNIGGTLERTDWVAKAFERKQAEISRTNKIVGAAKSGAFERSAQMLDNDNIDHFPGALRALEIYNTALATHRSVARSRSDSAAARQGMKDLSAMSRPGQSGGLTPAQKDQFSKENAKFSAAVQQRPPKKKGSGETRRGFANPAVQKSAQQARGVQNISDWAEDAEIGGA